MNKKFNKNKKVNIFSGEGAEPNEIDASQAIGGVFSGLQGLSGIYDASKALATTHGVEDIENQLEDVKSTTYAMGNNNSLLDSWYSNPESVDINYDTVRGMRSSDVAGGILGATGQGAMTGLQVGGPWGALIGGAVGLLSSGAGAIAGHFNTKYDVERLKKEQEKAEKQRAVNFETAITGTQKMNIKNNMSNYFDLGGHSSFSNYDNNVTTINNGSTHELNPNTGVQIGTDNQGIPNMVEEGEVIYDDYVYSNRLIPDSKILRTLGLPKGGTKASFADIANIIQKESKERPYDPISKKGLKANMDKLKNYQEEVRIAKQQKKQQDFINSLTPEELAYLEQTAMQQQQVHDQPQMQEQVPVQNNMFDDGGPFLNETILSILQDLQTQKNIQKWIDHHVQMPPTQALRDEVYKTFPIQPSSDAKTDAQLQAEASEYLENNPLVEHPIVDEKPQYVPGTLKRIFAPNGRGAESLRYSPAIASGISVLADAFGANDPKYDNSDRIRTAANSIRNIGFSPLTDYMEYRPLDVNYYANKLGNQAAGSRAALMNTSGGNAAVARASMIASDNNYLGQLGNLYRQAEESNLNQRAQVAQFNRGTNQANMQAGLQAAMSNQRRDAQVANMLVKEAAMREEIAGQAAQAKEANMNNFIDNMGNIGNESFWSNIIKDNPSLLYDYRGQYKQANGGYLNKKKRK